MSNNIKATHSLIIYVYSKIYIILFINLFVLSTIFGINYLKKEKFTSLAKIRTFVSATFYSEQSDFLKEDVIFEEFVNILMNKNIVNKKILESLNEINLSKENENIAFEITKSMDHEVFSEPQLLYTGSGINITMSYDDRDILSKINDQTITKLIQHQKSQITRKLKEHLLTYEIELKAHEVTLDLISRDVALITKEMVYDESGEELGSYGIDLLSAKTQNQLINDRAILLSEYLDTIEEKNEILKRTLKLESFLETNLPDYSPVMYTSLENQIRSNKNNIAIMIIIAFLITNFFIIFGLASFKLYITELNK